MTRILRLFSRRKSPEQIRRKAMEWAIATATENESASQVVRHAHAYVRYWLLEEVS